MKALALAIAAGATFASGQAAAEPLSQACEEAVALSALPERLRAGASVYVMTEKGYRKTIEGDGSFTCIIERNHPQTLAPQCVDANGAAQIIPGIIYRGELVLAGKTGTEVQEAFDERAGRGEFQPPAGPGVNYMTSPYNYIYVESQNRLAHVPAHMMYYAPNLTNEDIGGSPRDAQENTGHPFIVNPGIHGYMVAFVDQPSEGDAVQAACAGEVGDQPPPLSLGSD